VVKASFSPGGPGFESKAYASSILHGQLTGPRYCFQGFCVRFWPTLDPCFLVAKGISFDF